MKTLLATIAACSALIGFIPAASGQGNVTFTPINSATYSNYLGQAMWVGVVDTRGGSGFLSPVNTYHGGSLGGANQTSIQLTDGNNTAGLSYQILSGSPSLIVGETQSSSISSLSPVMDLVIGIFSPLQPNGFGQTANVSDLYIGSNYEPSVADTATSTFSGMLCSFDNPTSAFNFACTLNTGFDSASQIYIVAVPTPEPSTLALAGLGGVALFFFARRKAKSVRL